MLTYRCLSTAVTNHEWSWASNYTLSELGSFQLEYRYLSAVTGDRSYLHFLSELRYFFSKVERPRGLLYNRLRCTGQWLGGEGGEWCSLDTDQRLYHTATLKSFVQSDLVAHKALDEYKTNTDAVDSARLWRTSSPTDNTSVHLYSVAYNRRTRHYRNVMRHSQCYLGAMYALGADAITRYTRLRPIANQALAQMDADRVERHWTIATQITDTCQHHWITGPNTRGAHVLR